MRRLYTCLAVLILSAAAALAQITGGQISGKVFDTSGAVVPRCSVVAIRVATGFSQTARPARRRIPTTRGPTTVFPQSIAHRW